MSARLTRQLWTASTWSAVSALQPSERLREARQRSSFGPVDAGLEDEVRRHACADTRGHCARGRSRSRAAHARSASQGRDPRRDDMAGETAPRSARFETKQSASYPGGWELGADQVSSRRSPTFWTSLAAETAREASASSGHCEHACVLRAARAPGTHRSRPSPSPRGLQAAGPTNDVPARGAGIVLPARAQSPSLSVMHVAAREATPRTTRRASLAAIPQSESSLPSGERRARSGASPRARARS